MFGSSSSPPREGALDESAVASPSPQVEGTNPMAQTEGTLPPVKASEDVAGGDKRASQSPRRSSQSVDGAGEKKRRSSGVRDKASSLLAGAKNSLHFSQNPNTRGFTGESNSQTPLQKLGKQDPALSVPQGQHNNSAGESHPGPRSTFRVGVWEDKNKKCRRTMEDTHAFLYNFLHTPAPILSKDIKSPGSEISSKSTQSSGSALTTVPSHSNADMMETDNGYFAIFDGHAGTFAADWCGKKLHIILEQMIRKNPNTPIPELLDQTFTNVDAQLEKLPLKNSGCTAITAVLRWEDRIPNSQSATGSTAIAPATAAAIKAQMEEPAAKSTDDKSAVNATEADANDKSLPALNTSSLPPSAEATHAKLKTSATRQRVLYTANVGDARIVLCRNGKALRLSYDHKGSDENEGKRVAAAGGLILNNRVNGVLAVTRALGDAYMKDLVTGHPYTTETVIQPDLDEFIILACDGLWDVCSDQEAVDLVRNVSDPVAASKLLVDHALARFSTDNLSCMIVRFNRTALIDNHNNPSSAIGVEGDALSSPRHDKPLVSEVDKIVGDAKQKVAEGGDAIGISGCNSGKGHDPVLEPDSTRKSLEQMERVVEEDPVLVEGDDANEMKVSGIEDVDPETRSSLKGLPLIANDAAAKSPTTPESAKQ